MKSLVSYLVTCSIQRRLFPEQMSRQPTAPYLARTTHRNPPKYLHFPEYDAQLRLYVHITTRVPTYRAKKRSYLSHFSPSSKTRKFETHWPLPHTKKETPEKSTTLLVDKHCSPLNNHAHARTFSKAKWLNSMTSRPRAVNSASGGRPAMVSILHRRRVNN